MKPDHSLPRLLTVREVAQYLQLSEKTVRRRIETGGLVVHRLGRSVRIAEKDLAVMVMSSRDP